MSSSEIEDDRIERLIHITDLVKGVVFWWPTHKAFFFLKGANWRDELALPDSSPEIRFIQFTTESLLINPHHISQHETLRKQLEDCRVAA